MAKESIRTCQSPCPFIVFSYSPSNIAMYVWVTMMGQIVANGCSLHFPPPQSSTPSHINSPSSTTLWALHSSGGSLALCQHGPERSPCVASIEVFFYLVSNWLPNAQALFNKTFQRTTPTWGTYCLRLLSKKTMILGLQLIYSI